MYDYILIVEDDSDINGMLVEMAGESVLARIKEENPDVSVLVISAKEGVNTRISLLHAGADDYLTKPFDMEELLARLEAVLRRNPDFLILDEPINGLDPAGIKEIRELLIKLNREREITILISSHILGELSKLATHYGIIKDGVLIEEFDAQDLEARCRRCHKLAVDNTERAARVLEEQLQIQNYDIPEPGVIRIFEHLERTAETNRVLVENSVELRESYLAGQDLEGYFMELLGGIDHD